MTAAKKIPVEKGLDNSLALMKEGFYFIPNRMKKFNTNIFRTRLLGGQKVICISGAGAGEIFYDNTLFKREGVAPNRIKESLFGQGGVQGLDGAAHRHRKALFMSQMTPDNIKEIRQIAGKQWEIAIEDWQNKDRIELLYEAEKIFCITACQWAGVPLKAKNVMTRTKDLAAMIDAFGAIGPRHWEGRMARNRAEKWIEDIIGKVRSNEMKVEEDKPLHAVAWHRDLNHTLLDVKTVAVEVLNLLRPIVAIGRYVMFGALAMHDFPETREKLKNDKRETYSQMFTQEVRRYYPFGPFLGAIAKKDFEWQGFPIKEDTLVLLDVHGINHSSDLWENPNTFWPERFHEWDGSPFNFVPQGGGDYHDGHRCAGEWITIELMKVSLEFLAKRISYDVPEQDFSYSMSRMPTMPKSRFIMENVRWR
ncbi:cytochrome P450 [Virgibacillus sp. YIM 98842]|uniref:cytochrome P450 n=1 Tax=Virgibacillus sp. YIM 98842 TaxID=2663533 RepID=UPI0013DAD9B1|nr:cytochrome P450 [Virgibacillus sp. YIM 98842]